MASRDFFIYSAEFLPLNANATANVRIPVQGDSAFELTAISGDVKATDATETAIADPSLTVMLVDEGSGRRIFDRAQIWANIIGTAQRPFVLPQFKTFAPNSVLSVEVADLSTLTRRVRISFIGYKIFP